MSLTDYPRIADWLVARDGRLLVQSGKVNIGQRISTALAQIAHEELGVPLDSIDVAAVRTGAVPDEGITSGSNSIEQSGHAIRCAAATLKHYLLEQAAARFGGAPQDWQWEAGALHLPGTNHRVHVIDLIPDLASDLLVDPAAQPTTRSAGALPLPPMRGIADMVRGQFTFIHDMDLPAMLHARILRPPHIHARLKAIDVDPGKLAEQGLRLIQDGSFLALVGEVEWTVVQTAQKLCLACDWDLGPGLPEGDVFQQLNTTKATRLHAPGAIPAEGPIPEPLTAPDHRARFERPYQLHASLGPSAAMACWEGKKLTLYSQSQGIYPLRASIADSLGLSLTQVEITHVPGAGCYGHTGADDAAFEAALIAMAVPGRPILLKWTREDEHRYEPFAPAMAVDLEATLEDGAITALSAEVFSDTHRGRPRAGPDRAGPRKLLANRFRKAALAPPDAVANMGEHAGMHRNLDPIYDFSHKRLIKNLVPDLPHRTSAMRCLGGAANIFAIESFVDDLAQKTGADPFDFRLNHLKDARARDVLTKLRHQVADWPDLPEGSGRGVAYGQYKNQMTRVAVCVELDVNDAAKVHLRRVALVADAGRVIDAGGLNAQLEGGFIQAASWALYEEVRWDRDGILTQDWDSYPVIRFDNIPEIEVTLIDRPDEKAVGAGEAAPGPTIAAIRNAIRAAVGIRMTRMPFTSEQIMATAMDAGSDPR